MGKPSPKKQPSDTEQRRGSDRSVRAKTDPANEGRKEQRGKPHELTSDHNEPSAQVEEATEKRMQG